MFDRPIRTSIKTPERMMRVAKLERLSVVTPKVSLSTGREIG